MKQPAPPDMKVRLSSELRRHIEDAARENNRTMNAEIVSRLEQSFRVAAPPTTGNFAGTEQQSSLDELRQRVSDLEGGFLGGDPLQYIVSELNDLVQRVTVLEGQSAKSEPADQ